MRTIRRTAAFERDNKREKSGGYARTLDANLRTIVADLGARQGLPWRHQLGPDDRSAIGDGVAFPHAVSGYNDGRTIPARVFAEEMVGRRRYLP